MMNEFLLYKHVDDILNNALDDIPLDKWNWVQKRNVTYWSSHYKFIRLRDLILTPIEKKEEK